MNSIVFNPPFYGRLPVSVSPRPVLALLALLTMFVLSGPVLRWLDPVAGVVDFGILSLVILGLLAGLACVVISQWLLGLLWPVFRNFRKYHFEPIFKSLLPWQKILFYFGFFFLVLYALVACIAAVF